MTEQTTKETILVQMTDPISKESVNVPEELKPFIQNLVQFNKNLGKSQTSAENEELKGQIDELSKAISILQEEKKKQKEKPNNEDIEVLKKQYSEVSKQMNDQIEQTKKEKELWEHKYVEGRIQNDIYEALAKYDVYNRNQVASLLRTVGSARLKDEFDITTGEKNGNFTTILTLDLPDENKNIKSVELPVKDAVDKFFSLEENSYHLKNKLASGSGTKQAFKTDGASKTMKRENFNQLTPTQQIETVKAGTTIID